MMKLEKNFFRRKERKSKIDSHQILNNLLYHRVKKEPLQQDEE